jgi:hypothetical protein
MIAYLLGFLTFPVLLLILVAMVFLCDRTGLTDWWHSGVHQGRYVRRKPGG